MGDVGRRLGAMLATGLILVATSVLPVLAAEYPPSPDPDAEPIGPEPVDPTPPRPPTPPPPRPGPAPDTDPTPDPAPVPPTPQPTDPTGPTPAPPPSPESPDVDPGGGTGDRDGEPIEIDIRPAPPEVGPDDPALQVIPGVRPSDDGGRIVGLPPREDGTAREPTLAQIVLVEAGPLGMLLTGESCGGELLDVDASGALRTSPGGSLIVAGGGFLGEAEVATWLFSEPMLLKTQVTLADGTVVKSAPVPDDVMVGRHVAQITGVGADSAPYRVALDVLVVDCDPGRGLLGLPRGAGWWLLALLLLAAGWWLLLFRRVRRIQLAAHPGDRIIAVRERAAARAARKPVDAEVRGGPTGLGPRDRAVEATDLRVVGSDVIDLDLRPVPASATVVVEAAGATWVLAVRRSDGRYEPVAQDGLPRLRPGSALVTVVDGARRGSRLEVTLQSLRDDERDDRGIEQVVLGHLRADGDGRSRGDLLLPDDLGTLPLVIGLRLRGR